MKAPPTNGVGGGRVAHLKPEDSRELSDPALERTFLASALHYPEILLASDITEADFYAGAHARVYAALLSLVADGEPVGMVELQSRLHERGQLVGIGGVDYLLEIDAGIPSATGPWHRIRKLAARRRVRDLALLVASKAGDDEFARYYDQLVKARAELEAIDTPRSPIPTLADCVPSIAEFGPRLSLGLAGLNEATRGGVPAGRMIMLLGAPGSSKTNFATWLGDTWERAGCAVMILACDESRASIVTRLGQMDGFDRSLLEGQDEGRRNAFARNSRARNLLVADPSADKVSLEDAHRHMLTWAGERQRVLITDSLQTVWCRAADEFDTTREQIEAVVDTLDAFTRTGTIVVAISEMSRAGYRSGSREKDISALSAGAESRAIEYAAHLLLGLRPVKGEKGVIDVEIAKNRIGTEKLDLRMAVNFETLSFRELDKPDEDEEQAVREHVRDNALRERLIATVRANPDLRAGHAVVRLAKAKKRDGLACFRELVADGVIVKVEGCFRLSPSASWEQN